MVEPLLAVYAVVLSGVAFATWLFAFETRKTFRGGIFWNAWRMIATSILFIMASQIVTFFEAIYGSSDLSDAVGESFVALSSVLLLAGFYLFYKAWNPNRAATRG